MSVEEKSVERVKRMLDRWSGIQGPLRSGKKIPVHFVVLGQSYNLSLTCGLDCAQEKCLKHKCYFEVYSSLDDSQLNIILEILHKENDDLNQPVSTQQRFSRWGFKSFFKSLNR